MHPPDELYAENIERRKYCAFAGTNVWTALAKAFIKV